MVYLDFGYYVYGYKLVVDQEFEVLFLILILIVLIKLYGWLVDVLFVLIELKFYEIFDGVKVYWYEELIVWLIDIYVFCGMEKKSYELLGFIGF